MFKLHKYSCKKCIPALIIILFFIGLLPPNLYGQVKIKERVELQNSKGVESFIWPVNGCEYDTFDSSRIFVKFDPNPVSPGNITIASLWLDENFTWQYWPDGEPLLLRTFELDPDYGECVRIGDGLYRISIPDTVTSDSVAVAFNYINFRHFCAGKGSELVLDDKDCLSCFPYWRALSKGYTQDTLIIKPDSFVVYIEPEECYPGDTVQVVIKKRLSDGTLVDFPATQTYEIAKLEGCMLGNILADNDSGSYFYDVSQPIYFAAADTLVGDTTGTVLLQVGLVDPAKKKELPINHPTHIESNDCFIGSFLAEDYKLLSFNDYEPIILGWNPGTERITGAPEMPIMTMGADPQFPIGGAYTVYWTLDVKWVDHNHSYTHTFSGSKLWSSFNGPVIFDIPSETFPLDNTIVGGDELKLTVTIANHKVSKKISDLKILGTYSLSKNMVRDYVSTKLNEPKATFFDLTILYESVFKQFKSDGYVQMNKTNPPEIDFGICQIRRLGPDYPPPTIAEIWNWKENVNSGVVIFEDKRVKAVSYPNRVRTGNTWYIKNGKVEYNDPLMGKHVEWYPKGVKYSNATDFSDEQMYKEMFQRYVGGCYWRWHIQNPKDLNSGKWIPQPLGGHRRGDQVWNDYLDILNEDPPAGWED
jgi:hypothetical protein